MQPLEDDALGGGTLVLDAAVERVERTGEGYVVHATGTTRPCTLALEADAVIAATGFRTPLADLEELGAQTVAQGRIPALTTFWESVGAPGMYFAGNATQGSPGLRRHGIGASSPAVHGFRYNARVLAEHLADRYFGVRPERPRLEPEAVVPFLAHELAHAPELWTQKGYLARVVSLEEGALDEGVQPLAHFVDTAGPDAVAATVESNPSGEIYPVVYVRRGGTLEERMLPPDPLHAFDGPGYLAELEGALGARL